MEGGKDLERRWVGYVTDINTMQKEVLNKLIQRLKKSSRVRGVFTAGTTAKEMNLSSDIDLVIILDKNKEKIRSIYTNIGSRFADIFFFDIAFLTELKNKRKIFASSFEGMFINWLVNGKIEYDPGGLLSLAKKELKKNFSVQKISELEKNNFYVRVNYNFIANKRYYDSRSRLYHKALEIRLLYSVSEIVVAYFYFRNIPWRGEKAAIEYFEKHDARFLKEFLRYSASNSLDDKMQCYVALFRRVFSGKYKRWKKDFVVGLTVDNHYDQKFSNFWSKLSK